MLARELRGALVLGTEEWRLIEITLSTLLPLSLGLCLITRLLNLLDLELLDLL